MKLLDLLLNLAPPFVQDHFELIAFFAALTYACFTTHWILSTDWEAKFNWFSLILGTTGITYLHYSNVLYVHQYEPFLIAVWCTFLFYHSMTWKNKYQKVSDNLSSIASLKRYEGSLLRFFIVHPTMKNPSNQWNDPSFGNVVHILIVLIYATLVILHILPHITPYQCYYNNHTSPTCCRFNFVLEALDDTQSVHSNYCSGKVRIAFTGSWSTGKTTIISMLLGHQYSTAQISPAPTTDKFICLVMGSPYSDPIRSDDYERRVDCDIMSHVNDITHKICGRSLPNVLDVADQNDQFKDFVFFDMPGWQTEYASDCSYKTFYQQLLEKVDFVYIVWDVNHGKIDDTFAEFFKEYKAKGTDYELIYNRYTEKTADMGFLNQQYAKLNTGKEILSEMYTMKMHEYNEDRTSEFEEDLHLLRSKILSVNQTVHDNRKKMMKQKLLDVRSQITGLQSLRKLKIADRLINEELNVHHRPQRNWLYRFGIEL